MGEITEHPRFRTLREDMNSVAVQLSVLKRRFMNWLIMGGSAVQASARRRVKRAEEHAASCAAFPLVPCSSRGVARNDTAY